MSFTETRATLLDRPWAVDNLDAVLARFSQRQYVKAILFCDNAGSDVVLGANCSSCPALHTIIKQTIRKPSTSSAEFNYRSGTCHKFQTFPALLLPLPHTVSCLRIKFSHLHPAISSKVWARWASERFLIECRELLWHAGMLPFARELLKRGTVVVLAANEVPSINDITAVELRSVVQLAAMFDKVIGRSLVEGVLYVVSTGTSMPVIDLSKVRESLRMVHNCIDAFHGQKQYYVSMRARCSHVRKVHVIIPDSALIHALAHCQVV